MMGGCEKGGAVASLNEAEEVTAGGGGEDEVGGGEDKIGGGGRGGNRWPQEETMALLAIRSDMDLAFRKATLKAPLWEEVSRKLGEVGFNRTPKKCKEKFENVYKYHRRTKEGRSRRQTAKAYKFFQQLEALSPPLPLSPASTPAADVTANLMIEPIASYDHHHLLHDTHGGGGHGRPDTTRSRSPSTEDTHDDADFAFTCTAAASLSTATLSSSSSSGDDGDSGEKVQGGRRRRRRKKKLAALFDRLMKEVVEKQENLQRQFMDAIDKCEAQRRAREEVWKAQELAKIKREQDILAQERAIAAAKDAAVMAFLHKMSSSPSSSCSRIIKSFPSELEPPPLPPPDERAGQKSAAEITMATAATTSSHDNNSNNNSIIITDRDNQSSTRTAVSLFNNSSSNNNNNNNNNNDDDNNNNNQIQTSSSSAPAVAYSSSSSRWPKAEVDALIRIRTDMEQRYHENGPKGPLWEEISLEMKKLGYDRSAKKCKEKWENINKYFRRVKDTKRKRAEDAKTCPYFHQLDALYREKGASTTTAVCNNTAAVTCSVAPVHTASSNSGLHLKPEELLMQMMVRDRPHQIGCCGASPQNANIDDMEGETTGEDDEDADFDEAPEADQGDGDAYQIVATNNSSSLAVMRC